MNTQNSAGIRIEVLRGRVLRGERIVPLQPRGLEICIALACHGGAMAIGRLADALFPELDTYAAKGRLRVYVHRLRGQLFGAVEREQGLYRLGRSVTVDIDALALSIAQPVRDVEQRAALLETCAALHRPRNGPPFDRWCWFTGVDSRLAQLADDAARRVGEELVDDDASRAAVAIASSALYHDPINESALTLMIRALERLGYRSRAMRAYREYERALQRELQTSPGDRIRALVAQAAPA